ncbi:G-Patch Domain And Kow Motifs-Containing Protein, partial [Manis pentadactyla]
TPGTFPCGCTQLGTLPHAEARLDSLQSLTDQNTEKHTLRSKLPLRRTKHGEAHTRGQLINTTLYHCPSKQNGSESHFPSSSKRSLSFLFRPLNYKVPTFRLTKCAYENKQLSFIYIYQRLSLQDRRSEEQVCFTVSDTLSANV